MLLRDLHSYLSNPPFTCIITAVALYFPHALWQNFFPYSHGLGPANHYFYYCGLFWEVIVTGIRQPFLSPLFLAQKKLIYIRGPNNVCAHTLVSCRQVNSCSYEGSSAAIESSAINRYM